MERPVRFLFFLYSFPPALGTAAKRNHRLAKAISSKASESHVFTSSKTSKSTTQEANISVTSIPTFDYRLFLRRRSKDGALPESNKKGVIAQTMIRLVNTFPVNILLGEGGLIYFFNLIIKGKRLIKRKRITHLYSSYRPFADHYAAYWLKKWHPEVYWIADFRDLIIDPHYNHILFPKTHQSFFKKIFSKADLLTTVSDGLAKHLLAYNTNVVTLRNGIDDDFHPVQPEPSTYFTIVYTGSMFLDKRNAEPIFHALQELIQDTKIDGSKLRILYAGKDGKIWKDMAARYRFNSIFEDKGIISNDSAKALQTEACINVLLTISSDQLQGVLTGKMIEYFEAGSPVLGIVVHQNDMELKRILHEVEIGDSFSDQEMDFPGVKEFIYQEYMKWKATGNNRKPVNVDVLKSTYSMAFTMRPFFEKIGLLN